MRQQKVSKTFDLSIYGVKDTPTFPSMVFKAHAVKVAFISIYGLKHTPILTSAYYNNTKHMLILCVCVYSLFSSCVVVPVHCVVGVV